MFPEDKLETRKAQIEGNQGLNWKKLQEKTEE